MSAEMFPFPVQKFSNEAIIQTWQEKYSKNLFN